MVLSGRSCPLRPQYILKYTCEGHDNSESSVKFSPDGKWLASSCKFSAQHPSPAVSICLAAADKTIRIWNAVDGKFESILKGHSQVELVHCLGLGPALSAASNVRGPGRVRRGLVIRLPVYLFRIRRQDSQSLGRQRGAVFVVLVLQSFHSF